MSLPINLTDEQAWELVKRENFILAWPRRILRTRKCVTVFVVGDAVTIPCPVNIFKNTDETYTVRLGHGAGSYSEDMAIAKRSSTSAIFD